MKHGHVVYMHKHAYTVFMYMYVRVFVKYRVSVKTQYTQYIYSMSKRILIYIWYKQD